MLKHLVFYVIILFLIFSAISLADDNNQVYFKFQIYPGDDLGKLTRIVSIDNVKDNIVFAYATDSQFDNFKTLGYDYTILPDPGSLIEPRMSDDKDIILDWDTYPTYEAYVAMMYAFATDYPTLCRVENIGNSVQGREILFAKLSANVDIEENEPEIMYSSTMHGDETTGYILMLRLIDYLLTNYGTDPQATRMLDSMEIWINPLANPDGTYYTGNNSVNGARRWNANGEDLNRNFPDPDNGPHPDGASWQQETIAMMNFFDQHSFTISTNFHGGAEVVNYPWDTWSRLHTDNDWFVDICREYADSAQANSPSGYMTDLNNGITNGYAWYPIAGGRQDYLNYWKGCRETTIELSSTKLLPESQLDAHWTYNKGALLSYIEQAFYGIRGVVADISTGLPVAATVSVIGHDIDSSEVYTDPDAGDYYRMIEAGTYNLRFTAPGYYPHTVNSITVIDRNVVVVDVQMQSMPPALEFYEHNAENISAGDTVSMNITLINNGGQLASGVNAALSSTDSYIDILQSVSSYPDISPAGGTSISIAEYIFVVQGDCPSDHRLDFELGITASGGYADTVFFAITVDPTIEDFETGDFSSFDWQMGGNANWIIVASDVYEGSYSAKSGDISDGQTSTIEIDYNVSSPDTISFHFKVSSENNYDYLKFYIDGYLQDEWSGEDDWTEAGFSVSAGERNFKWEYFKDGSVSNGSDCAWIDYITFPMTMEILEITTTSLPDWNVGLPYSQQLEATGGVGNLSWSDQYSDLIGTGLALSSGGLLSGMPTSAGPVNFTALVEDQGSQSDSKAFSFTINQSLEITTDTLPDWTINRPYSQQLEVSGGTGSIAWSDLNNDLEGTGLSLSSSGLLSGSASLAGPILFTARVKDSVGDMDDNAFDITINQAVEITTTELPDGCVDSPYNYQLEATGGTDSLVWTDRDGDLDGTGLVLVSNGVLSGIPDDAASITFFAVAADITGSFDETQLSIEITESFVPGDANGDGRVIGSDVTYLINYFRGINPAPEPYLAGDANGDCQVIGSDIIYLVNYFRGAGDPPVMGDCGGMILKADPK
ncbi:MAG: carboxypeptidase regulatory-like domain-containing protein [candidate division Zixibacteria bacterium]|nr:carboxypeptidase regulatory-like domain-containing protein [candidate division Zixibacteria bacterium]